MISAVGTARSSFIQAIQAAKEGDFKGAQKYMQEGEGAFQEGHAAHMALLEYETSQPEGQTAMNLLLVHAEDQLMSAETFQILTKEFIELYQKLEN